MKINQYKIILLFIFTISSSAIYADVYKCRNDNGQITYSGKPCANNPKKIELKTSPRKLFMKGTYNGKPHEIEYKEVFNEEILKDFNVTEDADGTMRFTPKSGDSVTYTSE